MTAAAHDNQGLVHSHGRAASRRNLTIALGLTVGYMVVELVGGFLANSLSLLADAGQAHRVTLEEGDVAEMAFAPCSMAVLNFTLQFIAPQKRDALIQRLAEATVPGGILVLSEKIRFADPHLQELNTQLHHEFKRANGYSDMEIAQKRSALEQVLIPETLDSHRQRLKGAGFASIDVWFQCFNFASLVAIK